jgi:hypothetical protein
MKFVSKDHVSQEDCLPTCKYCKPLSNPVDGLLKTKKKAINVGVSPGRGKFLVKPSQRMGIRSGLMPDDFRSS